MDEQILKDFLATLESNSYDYDSTLSKFPELANYDVQLLKDYAATAEANNYNYEVVNSKFPEFEFTGLKKKEDSEPTSRWEDLALPTEQVEEGPISLEYSQQKNLDAQEPVAPLLEDKADPSSPDFKFDVQEVQEVSEINEKPSVQIEDKIEDTERTIGINKAKDLIVSPITEDEALTEQDRINSISIKNKFPESANDPVVLRNSEDQFERGIGRINDLFSQTEAKAAADLRKAFDQYGFKFEEAVGGIDAIKVTSANGKEITVRRKVGNKDAKVTELKDFLNENRVASTVVQNRINTSLGKDTKKEKRALTEEDLEEESKIYTNQFDSYQKNVSDYNKRKKALSNSTPTNEQEIAVYNKEAGNLNALSVSLNKEQENLISSQGELEKLAGDYAYYESQKWDVPSLMIQSIANGLLSASVGVGSFVADAVDVLDYTENDAVYKAFKDKLREGRDMILEDLEILGTTKEAIGKVKKDSFVAGALIGTLESIPAMVAGIGGLFAHSYAGADDALRQYKGYEDIGDLEAFTLKVGLSAAGAYLEKAGLDNAMGKTGLLNRFLLQTLKTIPKDASEIVVHQTLKRKAIDFVKGLGSATAGEGATGGAQEAVDIGIKAAYNEMKGINVFKTPETIGQFFEQVVEASAAEAIGGLALGGAGSVATALSNEKVMDLPDGVIEMFEMMSSSNKFDPLFSKSLKVQLAKGEITKEEAQEQLDNYREAKSSMKQIPKDYTTPQKKIAMSLLGIKKRLEKTIEAGDPDLVKDLKKQLDDVKERLSTVKQDVTNIKEGVEITDPNETYFFDFKSKKEIPDALKGLKPVAETISKRSKLGKTQNIRLGFKGTQLVESGFAVIDNEIKLLEENRSKELKEIDDKKFDDTLKLVTDENGKTYRNTKARQKKAEQDRINKVYDDKIAKLNIEKEKATEAETKKDVESEAKKQSTLVKEGEIAEDKSTEAENVDDVKEVSEPVKEGEIAGEVAPSEKSVDEQVDVLTNILEGKTPVEETKALPRKEIDNQVDNAKKALSKVGPEVEIIVSESEAEYKKATKEGRNQNTGGSEIERQSKKSIKRPKSAKKIIGKSKRDKVTVDEMSSLKTQIRLEAKAAKGAKTDLNQKRKDLAKIIKDFEKGKNITTANSQTIINKISKVNLDNEAAVEKLLDYIAKQYGIAKVKEETSASNTKRKRAKNNIKSKIGTAKDTFNIFKKLFSYDSKLITDKKLKAKYEAIVGRFGSSSAVLSVKDLKSEAEIAKEIIESIEEEYSTFEDLADVFYENMVKDEDGNIDYKATMKVLSEGTETILVPDQLAILEKYKSKLELKEAKESLTPEQQKVVTEGLIDEAMKVKVKNNVTDDNNSRESAGKLIKLLENRKNLEGLSDNQLKSIPQILDNIQNGIFTFRANTIMNALDVKENSDAITIKLNKARAMAIESIIRGLQSTLPFQATSAYNQIASNPLKDIDTILGLDGTEVYDRTFKRMGSAFAAFQEATRDVNEKLTEVNTKLTKAFNAKENEISQAKFRMQAYMLQLEYESNTELQGKKGTVFEAVDWIDATINELVGKKQEATIKILRKVREQVKGKSSQEIKSKLTRVEKEAISIVKKINEETAEKALYVGAIVRGSRPNMINEYTHHDIMSTADLSKKEATDYLNKMNNVKTKAGTIESRSSGVKPINMDILNSTMKGAKQTLLDFYVTNENRVIKKTLSEVKKKVEDKSENKRNNTILKAAEISPQEFAVAMEEAYDKAMSIAFSNSYGSTSVLDKMVSFGYQAQLASVPRAFAELSSNLGYVALSSPKLFAEGVSLFTKIGLAESIEYMKLSGSSELGKFTGAKNTGKSVDILAKNADLSKAKGRNDLANFVKTAKNTQAGALVNKAAETVADILISTPDKAVSMPLWLGSFTRSIKEKGLDLEKFKSDESYRTDNAKAIESARNEADQELNRAAGSQNIFASVLKNKVDKANDSAVKQAGKYVNGYLTNFLIFEYSTARKGIIQITKEGKINKLEGLSLLAATTTRMASYSILYKIFSSLFFGAFGAEDEQEDELEANDVTRAIVGSGVSLLLGRNFGTIARKGLNFGTEFLNKEYGQVLRGDEEYDSFEHGLGLAFFNPSEEDLKRKRLEKKVFREISGPLSNHVGLLFDMTYSAYDYINAKNDQEKSKAADKLIGQVLFETFGLFVGKTPLFKDLKKGLYQIPTNNEFAIKDKQYSYSELKGENEIKFATEEEKFQSKPEIKKIDIELNKVTRLIEGGTLSEENEIKAKQKQSTLKDDKKALKREYMDEQFGFKDKKDIGKVSKNDNVNDKSIDEQMAEMEIIDERTYKEYKEENERKYNKTLRKYKSNRTYRKSEDQKSKLTRKLKDAQRKKRDNLIPELKAKIKLIQQEMKGNKREFFSKAFKK
tara:strand:+ start:3384 stop:10547 length:7164 start_codon:yes stop_codon:yes gene_type:complete